MPSEKIEEYLRQILSGLVSKPEEISIERKADEMGVLFIVKVAPDEWGKVIGTLEERQDELIKT